MSEKITRIDTLTLPDGTMLQSTTNGLPEDVQEFSAAQLRGLSKLFRMPPLKLECFDCDGGSLGTVEQDKDGSIKLPPGTVTTKGGGTGGTTCG